MTTDIVNVGPKLTKQLGITIMGDQSNMIDATGERSLKKHAYIKNTEPDSNAFLVAQFLKRTMLIGT